MGHLAGDDIAFRLTMALYFAFGALGGLWIPPSAMPHVMQDVGQALPSNGLAELGWRIGGRPGAGAGGDPGAHIVDAWQRDSRTPGLPPARHPVTRPVVSHHTRNCRALRKGRSPMYSRNSLGADPRPGIPAKAAHQ